jgi:hypothetical protein
MQQYDTEGMVYRSKMEMEPMAMPPDAFSYPRYMSAPNKFIPLIAPNQYPRPMMSGMGAPMYNPMAGMGIPMGPLAPFQNPMGMMNQPSLRFYAPPPYHSSMPPFSYDPRPSVPSSSHALPPPTSNSHFENFDIDKTNSYLWSK